MLEIAAKQLGSKAALLAAAAASKCAHERAEAWEMNPFFLKDCWRGETSVPTIGQGLCSKFNGLFDSSGAAQPPFGAKRSAKLPTAPESERALKTKAQGIASASKLNWLPSQGPPSGGLTCCSTTFSRLVLKALHTGIVGGTAARW